MIDAGLQVTALREHQECEWQAFQLLEEGADAKSAGPSSPNGSP